jgi:hypothetical protein
MTIVTGADGNQTFATAQTLDGSLFTIPIPPLPSDPNVVNSSTVPYVTVNAVAEGGFDYYVFTLTTDTKVTFDIDNRSTDLWLELYDADQILLVSQDDSGILDPGSPSSTLSTDPLFSTDLTAGTYYVRVGMPDFNTAGVPIGGLAGGVSYSLHISTGEPPPNSPPTLTGALTATVDEGASVVLGGSDLG